MLEVNIQKELSREQGRRNVNISFSSDKNKLIAVTGPSGVGKTTFLKMLAGLVKPDDGILKYNTSTWFNSATNTNIRPQQRNIGFVFQDYALFPNLTVKENITFALTDKGQGSKVYDMLDLIELTALADKKPYMLSGGQQQRVALARALVRRPQLLLLDEPMSALDSGKRYKMQEEIMRIQKELQLTILMVSHDASEVNRLADAVLHLYNDGSVGFEEKVKQSGALNEMICLSGEIVKMEKVDDSVQLTILSDGFIFTQKVSISEEGLYRIGQRLRISAMVSDVRIVF